MNLFFRFGFVFGFQNQNAHLSMSSGIFSSVSSIVRIIDDANSCFTFCYSLLSPSASSSRFALHHTCCQWTVGCAVFISDASTHSFWTNVYLLFHSLSLLALRVCLSNEIVMHRNSSISITWSNKKPKTNTLSFTLVCSLAFIYSQNRILRYYWVHSTRARERGGERSNWVREW